MLIALLMLACGGPEAPRSQPRVVEATTPEEVAAQRAEERAKLQVGTLTQQGSTWTTQEGPPPAITHADCDAITSDPVGDRCITGHISCGDTVVGHTVGGTDRFDTRFYEQFFCTPATTDHNLGNERVYVLQMPEGDHHANIWLDTPCADLDLAAIKWNETDPECPTKGHRVDNCEMNRQGSTRRERVRINSRNADRWLIVVEGEGRNDGAFALHVACAPGL